VSIKPYGSITNVLPMSDLQLLQEIYDKTVELNESTEFIIHRAAMPRIKRVRLTRVTVNEINDQLTKIAAHPIHIFGVDDMKVPSPALPISLVPAPLQILLGNQRSWGELARRGISRLC
jgi:hypothetical protein